MVLEKGDFICTFDLKSGYHHVDIHEESQWFLGFAWEHSYYMSTLFTKLMRLLVKLWRGWGVVHIDDGTEAIDAFAVDWSGKNNWLCPPVHLVCKVLQHAVQWLVYLLQNSKSVNRKALM